MATNEPPLPRDWKRFPVGNITRIKRSQRRMRVAYRNWHRWIDEQVDAIPGREITANARGLTVNRYGYQIDLAQLEMIIREMARKLGEEIPDEQFWQAIRAAYEKGTGDEVVNLATIASGIYTREITQVIQSEPWQRRVALIRSRVLEDLRGITGDAVNDLRGVLTRGVEDGINPMQLKQQISERVGVNMNRAERLARTEITMTYRRARWDEDEDANERLGIRTGLLWISGFLPDSRKTHLALNGEVVTQDFVREFYSFAKNAVNCVCNQTSILLNDDGTPATPGIIERVKRDGQQRGAHKSPITTNCEVCSNE